MNNDPKVLVPQLATELLYKSFRNADAPVMPDELTHASVSMKLWIKEVALDEHLFMMSDCPGGPRCIDQIIPAVLCYRMIIAKAQELGATIEGERCPMIILEAHERFMDAELDLTKKVETQYDYQNRVVRFMQREYRGTIDD